MSSSIYLDCKFSDTKQWKIIDVGEEESGQVDDIDLAANYLGHFDYAPFRRVCFRNYCFSARH